MCDSDYDEGKGLSPKAGVAIVIAFSHLHILRRFSVK